MAKEVKYTILMKERWTFLDARGNPVDGYRITFQLPDGTTDWVDIPKARYTEENVRSEIEKVLPTHLAIS